MWITQWTDLGGHDHLALHHSEHEARWYARGILSSSTPTVSLLRVTAEEVIWQKPAQAATVLDYRERNT